MTPAMGSLVAAVGALWIAVIMWDAFEAIVLPRRVTRRLRPARMFYRMTWRVWSAVPRRMPPGGRRETFLSFYGPLSLLVLLAAWAASLVTAFAMVQAGIGTRLNVEGNGAFLDHLYLSGETFFTLGLGDVTPMSRVGRAVTVIEAGVGFGFLALVIGYLPVLYQSFSRRGVEITLLHARAGAARGGPEVGDGAPRRRRSRRGARPAARRLGAGSAAIARARSSRHGPGGRGCRPARGGRCRAQAGRAGADVRAVRRRARQAPPDAAAGLARRRRAPRELADERLGPATRRRPESVRRPARRLMESVNEVPKPSRGTCADRA